MDETLYTGMTLYARNGDKLTVTSASGGALTVAYGHRQYSRSTEDIGTTLFTSNPLEKTAAEEYSGDAVFQQEALHLNETQKELESFDGFLLRVDIGENGFVVGTQTGFDEVTKEELIASPYFARMDIEVDCQAENTLEVSYIGKKGVYHDNRLLVSDWRSEIGQKYYMKSITEFTYNDFDYALYLRRALQIRSSVLTGYKDEFLRSSYPGGQKSGADGGAHTERITDLFLQDILRQKHTQNTLTDIIESIQRNQNAIITHSEDDSLVVQGCAGSGKTMILLHRLSYIKYRNRSLDLSKIKIITPNSLFSMYINDLSKSLELEKIDRLTVSEYYAELLTRYYDIERSQLGRRCTPTELADYRESLLTAEKAAAGWPAVYSGSMREYLEQETAKALRSIFDDTMKISRISALLMDRLGYKMDESSEGIRVVSGLRSILQRVGKTFEPYTKQLGVFKASEAALQSAEQKYLEAKAGLNNADALLDAVIGEIVSKTPRLREKYEQRKSALLKQKSSLNTFSDCALRECDFCLSAVIYDRAKHVYEIDSKLLGREKDKIPFTEQEMELISSALKHLGRFSLSSVEKTVIGDIERRHGVKLSFRNKLYTRLLMNCVILGRPAQTERLLCVDEGHDLYANEYRLFAAVSSGVRFNLYGDINQVISHGEGVSDWDDLKSIFDFSLFTLNENYRNSANIIEYSNQTLGFSTMNLGIAGDPVQTLSFAGFIAHIRNNIIGTRKLSIIVKSKSAAIMKKLRGAIDEKLNLTEIVPGEISVLTPAEAKGLEFDTCYVITQGMNRNEKYISYTRALNELYIVSSAG